MNDDPQLPQQAVRSKGQAILKPDGDAEFPTTVRDISPFGIGVIAPHQINPGTFVRVDIHGHAAIGVVSNCQAEDGHFCVGISLNQSEPETPSA